MRDLLPHTLRDGVERIREGLQDTLDRWTGPLHRRRDEPLTETGRDLFAAIRPGTRFPAVNMEESADEVRVDVELPGFSKDDFRVEIAGQNLRISGERQDKRESKEGHWHYSECRYGAFTRSVRLPCEVDMNNVNANFRNGLLKMRLPKTEEARAHRVNVEVH